MQKYFLSEPYRAGYLCIFFHEHRGSISQYFSHGLPYLGRVEIDAHHRIRAHSLRLALHAVQRLLPGLVQQVRILMYLAAEDGPDAGDHIAAQASASYNEAPGEPDRFCDLIARDIGRAYDDDIIYHKNP